MFKNAYIFSFVLGMENHYFLPAALHDGNRSECDIGPALR